MRLTTIPYFCLLLGLSVLMIYKPAEGGVFMLDQDTWGTEEQCKELIVQHILTSGKAQFDPEVVRDCIAFLRSENLEHHENYPVAAVISEKSINEQVNFISPHPDSKKAPDTYERLTDSEVTDVSMKGDYKVTYEMKESAGEFKNSLSSEDLKLVSLEDDEPVEMYPENIVQEWPAVTMAGDETFSGKEEMGMEPTSNEDADAKETQTPHNGSEKEKPVHTQENFEESSDSDESPEKPRYPFLGKDYKPLPPKDEDLVDIYPEKPVPEWPAVILTRKKRGTEKATNIKATTKKGTNPNVSSGSPYWEKYTLKDYIELDQRGTNRPQTRIQLLIFYFKRFINWLKSMLGLGPRVVQS